MQFMVVRTKEAARLEFAKNLNAALDRMDAPKRGRPGWLSKELSGLVSRESCRKWLAGDDMPDQANLSVLLDHFKLNEQQLRTGSWGPSPDSADPRFAELQSAWPHLSDAERDVIMGVIRLARPTQSTSQPRRRRG